MSFAANTVLSGLFRNDGVIYGVLTVVGLVIVVTFVVGLIVLVIRSCNREWPTR
ncbi:MAG: hypothetical protein JWR24_4157 [Actinoallomurus sp.]|jgi:hypothetical protein|nr:hypothetical protein [Actinoallomurus sp.]